MQSTRSSNARTRRPNADFQMPLPRFHPAVYQSPSGSGSSSSVATTRPIRSPGPFKPPSSPRQQQTRQYSEATRKLIEYQQELLRAVGAAGPGTLPANIPHAPSLAPCGSPGPATPLTLEDQPNDYLTAGAARRVLHGDAGSSRELVETLIREEQERRQGGVQTGPSSPPVSPGPAT